ncbi:hypothetical protein ARMGADRAFT_330490 [Armillaria gallica]|uniref:Uncharacterized protein n=1 Tax=Armillaria gallica TaxID=47427 RepID=A0A2H3D6G1_ARMGA|nr:hypothetical protein ARMGADRAFT_330490 [Armillaria gallica]
MRDGPVFPVSRQITSVVDSLLASSMNSGRGGRFLIDKEEIRPLPHVLIPTYLEWRRTWGAGKRPRYISCHKRSSEQPGRLANHLSEVSLHARPRSDEESSEDARLLLWIIATDLVSRYVFEETMHAVF